MAPYGGSDGRRPARDRRPRFAESDTESDDYQPRRPRDGGRKPRSDRPDPPPTERPRRKSILRNPSDDSDSDVPRDRRGGERPRGSRHDSERKDSRQHKEFRERRDGYLSDEGETHKKARLRPGRPDYLDDDEEPGPRRRNGPPPYGPPAPGLLRPDAAMPPGGKPRASSAIPAGPIPAPRGEDTGPSRANYGSEPERFQRRRTYKDPDREPEQLPARPRREHRRHDDYDDESPPPRRDDARRRSARYPDDEREERGYRSDHAPRRRREDDRDPAPRSRRDDAGYRSDHGPRSSDYYRDDRPRRDKYGDDRRDRYGDDRRDRYGGDRRSRGYDDDRRVRSGGRGGKGGANWQKEVVPLFMQYGLPILRKEGPKYLQQAQKFIATRRQT